MSIDEIISGYITGAFTLGDVQHYLLDLLTPENVEELLERLPTEVRIPTEEWLVGPDPKKAVFTKFGWKTVPPNAVAAACKLRDARTQSR